MNTANKTESSKSRPANRGRPKTQSPKSEALRVRLVAEEKRAFSKLAKELGVPPSTLIRRMVREATSAGPTLFDDGIAALIDASNHLSAIGRNINQITRRLNQTDHPVDHGLKDDLAKLKFVLDGLKTDVRALASSSKDRKIKYLRQGTNGP